MTEYIAAHDIDEANFIVTLHIQGGVNKRIMQIDYRVLPRDFTDNHSSELKMGSNLNVTAQIAWFIPVEACIGYKLLTYKTENALTYLNSSMKTSSIIAVHDLCRTLNDTFTLKKADAALSERLNGEFWKSVSKSPSEPFESKALVDARTNMTKRETLIPVGAYEYLRDVVKSEVLPYYAIEFPRKIDLCDIVDPDIPRCYHLVHSGIIV